MSDEPTGLGPWLRGGKFLRDSAGPVDEKDKTIRRLETENEPLRGEVDRLLPLALPESNGKLTRKWGWTWAWIIFVIVAAGMFIAALVSNRVERPNTYSGSSPSNSVSSPSNSGSSLSESTKRAIFYNIVKTQDMNPDSNAWNQGAKEAAAKYHNIPMSEVNDIILEGAMNNWPTPDL